jgi:hypothetical protein
MMPERNGVVIRFPNYGNRFARADVYRLVGFGYAFVANVFYYDSWKGEIDADVDTSYSDQVLEKALKNEPHQIIIVPDECVNIINDWTAENWRSK